VVFLQGKAEECSGLWTPKADKGDKEGLKLYVHKRPGQRRGCGDANRGCFAWKTFFCLSFFFCAKLQVNLCQRNTMQQNLKGALLGIGNPLLDISAHVPLELLNKYELKTSNAILAEDKHQPLYDELVANYPVEYIAGGDCQNSMRAAQWMLSDQFPGATRYIGCVGKDEFGALLRKRAEADGVDVQYLEDSTVKTGTCAVLITNRDRSLVANLAAANNYKKQHLVENFRLVEEAQFIYVTGFFLTVSTESLLLLGEHAHQHDKPYLMNLSAPFLIELFWDKMESVLPYVDVLFANEHEAAALGKKLDWGSDLKEIARMAADLPKKNDKRKRTVVFTQGAEEVIVYQNGQLHSFPTPQVPKEEIVDLNGAGDCFVGGFLSQYIQGKDLARCISAAQYAAGVCIRTSGIKFEGKPSFA